MLKGWNDYSFYYSWKKLLFKAVTPRIYHQALLGNYGNSNLSKLCNFLLITRAYNYNCRLSEVAVNASSQAEEEVGKVTFFGHHSQNIETVW